MSFIIRKGKAGDCKAALELIHELALYEKAPEEVELSLEQLIDDGFGGNSIYELLVAEDRGQIIGIAIFYEKYSTWKGRCTYLEDLIVTKSKRGIGAGKALFEAVIKYSKEKNSGRMEWQVLDWNVPSINFYKAYDAELDGEWFNGRFTREQIQKIDLD
ncbi:MAG: GNAT family N-acetyltransferase [Flavobacteriales bacterium]|nr:GNAT family N-acetyltransferase [Flavobacteriales bacterium]